MSNISQEMSEFVCKCGVEFTSKFNLFRHQNTNRCSMNKSNSKSKKRMYKCKNKGCDNSFTRPDNLKRHTTTCKKKSTKITNKSHNKTNTTIGNKNNVGDVNNNCNINKEIIKGNKVNNVYLIVFGQDGHKSITNDVLNKLMNSKQSVYETLVQNVNFDPSNPQYHNVYCSDLKSGFGHIYEKNGWVTKCIDEVLDRLVDSKTSDMIKMLEVGADFLNDKTKNKLRSAIDEAREVINGYDGRSYPPGSRKRLKKYIKHIIYNNRKMVMKTKDKISKKRNKYNESDSDNESSKEYVSESGSEIDYDVVTYDDISNADDVYDV